MVRRDIDYLQHLNTRESKYSMLYRIDFDRTRSARTKGKIFIFEILKKSCDMRNRNAPRRIIDVRLSSLISMCIVDGRTNLMRTHLMSY